MRKTDIEPVTTLTVNRMPIPECLCASPGARRHWSGIDVVRVLGRPLVDSDVLMFEQHNSPSAV